MRNAKEDPVLRPRRGVILGCGVGLKDTTHSAFVAYVSGEAPLFSGWGSGDGGQTANAVEQESLVLFVFKSFMVVAWFRYRLLPVSEGEMAISRESVEGS